MCFPYDFNFTLVDSYSQTPVDFLVREKSFSLGSPEQVCDNRKCAGKTNTEQSFQSRFSAAATTGKQFLTHHWFQGDFSHSTHLAHMKHQRLLVNPLGDNFIFLLFHFPLVFGKEHLHSSGGGCGGPLQCSCLENPIDRGAWWATVHRVSMSWTWLKQLSVRAVLKSLTWK